MVRKITVLMPSGQLGGAEPVVIHHKTKQAAPANIGDSGPNERVTLTSGARLLDISQRRSLDPASGGEEPKKVTGAALTTGWPQH